MKAPEQIAVETFHDSKVILHSACGSEVSFNPADISTGDPELLEPGQGTIYYAACLECDEDLFEFETEGA